MRKRRALLVASVILFGAVGSQVYILVDLPCTTSAILIGSWKEACKPPDPDFSIGTVVWPVSSYSTEASLGPFREAFRQSCGTRTGLEAALCVSDHLARAFPNGEPSDEFVNVRFDPVDHLRRHLGGEPGHCLNRSSIVVAELLAVGIPARVVQLVPRTGWSGHTLVEVWDDTCRWVLADPTFGGAVGNQTGPAGLHELVLSPETVKWLPAGIHPRPVSLETSDLEAIYSRLLSTNVVYPEPWLYLRVGEKVAPWPLRGAFVHIGQPELTMGPAQTILRFGILLTAGTWIICVLAIGLQSRGRAKH